MLLLPDDVASTFVPSLLPVAGRSPRGEPLLGSTAGAALYLTIANGDGLVPWTTHGLVPSATSARKTSGRLNAFFGHLIARIEAHGGKLLLLQPETLIACWPAEATAAGTAEATLSATRCGLELQNTPMFEKMLQPAEASADGSVCGVGVNAYGGAAAMLRQRVKSPPVARGLRVGIGCGDVVLMLTGARHGTQFVPGGAAVMQAAAAASVCALRKVQPSPVPLAQPRSPRHDRTHHAPISAVLS